MTDMDEPLDNPSSFQNITTVTCTGKAISLEEQCPNQEEVPICNQYPNDKYRNFLAERSFIDICNDNRYLCLQQLFYESIAIKQG